MHDARAIGDCDAGETARVVRSQNSSVHHVRPLDFLDQIRCALNTWAASSIACAVAARRCGRDFVGFELNLDYCKLIDQRLAALEPAEQSAADNVSTPCP